MHYNILKFSAMIQHNTADHEYHYNKLLYIVHCKFIAPFKLSNIKDTYDVCIGS